MADQNSNPQEQNNLPAPAPQTSDQSTQQQMPVPDQTERTLSALGYIGFLCILPLVLKRDSAFCNYHGKQGLIFAIFQMILEMFTVFTGFYTFVLVVLYLILIYAALKAYRGEYVTLPMVSDIAKGLKL